MKVSKREMSAAYEAAILRRKQRYEQRTGQILEMPNPSRIKKKRMSWADIKQRYKFYRILGRNLRRENFVSAPLTVRFLLWLNRGRHR